MGGLLCVVAALPCPAAIAAHTWCESGMKKVGLAAPNSSCPTGLQQGPQPSLQCTVAARLCSFVLTSPSSEEHPHQQITRVLNRQEPIESISMPGGPLNFQAVVLAGGDDQRLHPLTTSCVKALMPVANKPLLSYSLNVLANAGLRHVFIVVMGDEAAASIQAWTSQEAAAGGPRIACEVIKAPKECNGTADALRAVAGRVTARTLVVMSGDLLTDFPVSAMVAKHQLNGTLATALLFKRKVSPTTETKPGKAPKNVDYIGLDSSGEHLLFYASSTEALKELKLPLHVVRQFGCITVRSDLVDAHMYVFDRSVLSLLNAKPQLQSLRQDLLPYLTQQQLKVTHTTALAAGRQASLAGPAALAETLNGLDLADAHTGADFMSLSHTVPSHTHGACRLDALRVHVVQEGSYCARISDAASYCEVNRDLADARTALHLTGLAASAAQENVVPASTQIGAKSTITAACVLGEACVLGDKSSIKRSVLGANCRLGSNVKVLNSVLQDGVVVGDGATIQNSILCAGVVVKERAALKDCQIGAGFVVAGGKDYTGEVLAPKGGRVLV